MTDQEYTLDQQRRRREWRDSINSLIPRRIKRTREVPLSPVGVALCIIAAVAFGTLLCWTISQGIKP